MTDALSWEIMNVTADDWESLDQIHPAVCRYLEPVGRDAVADVVARLLASGLFEQRPADAPLAEGWFRMTAAGRELWQAAADTYASQPERGTPADGGA